VIIFATRNEETILERFTAERAANGGWILIEPTGQGLVGGLIGAYTTPADMLVGIAAALGVHIAIGTPAVTTPSASPDRPVPDAEGWYQASGWPLLPGDLEPYLTVRYRGGETEDCTLSFAEWDWHMVTGPDPMSDQLPAINVPAPDDVVAFRPIGESARLWEVVSC
jgi:hypothetical protein